MKTLLLVSLLLCLPALVSAQGRARGGGKKAAQPRKLFPYAYTIDDLPKLPLI